MLHYSIFYFTSKYPEILYWSKAYMNDKDTNMMLKNNQKLKNVKCTVDQLKLIIPGYKTSLKEVIIQIFNGKLVLYKLILANHQYVELIIVPQSLRRVLFSHFHAGPSGGHMGEYKILYSMRIQFFWHRLR